MTRASPDAALAFLRCRTPDAWFDQAAANLDLLLIDHANCEKKAAGTALSLMYRYVDRPDLLKKMSRLAREELRHFELVHKLMQQLDVRYVHIKPARYAAGLRELVATHEPDRLIDTLITGAIVEARSCERFAGLSIRLDEPVRSLYADLLASEARHFQDYLSLAQRYADGADLSERTDRFLAADAELATAPDDQFRFHSGPLAAA